jgi:hypothetical protein
MPRVQGLVELVAEIVSRDDSEGAHRRQRTAFGAAKGVFAVAESNALAFGITGQVDPVHEHVSRLHAFPFAWVRAAAAAAAEIAGVVIALAGIVTPTRVVEH